MEVDSRSYRDNLRNQVEESYGKVVYTYTVHINQAKKIHAFQNILKWIEVICSAVPTGSFLVILSNISHRYSFWASLIGGICSVVSITLTLYSQNVDLRYMQKRHIEVSNQLWSIREDYISLLIDFEQLKVEDIVLKRNQLKNMVAKVYKKAPITDDDSYELSRKYLKENEAQFFTQKEINLLLPRNLRHQ